MPCRGARPCGARPRAHAGGLAGRLGRGSFRWLVSRLGRRRRRRRCQGRLLRLLGRLLRLGHLGLHIGLPLGREPRSRACRCVAELVRAREGSAKALRAQPVDQAQVACAHGDVYWRVAVESRDRVFPQQPAVGVQRLDCLDRRAVAAAHRAVQAGHAEGIAPHNRRAALEQHAQHVQVAGERGVVQPRVARVVRNVHRHPVLEQQPCARQPAVPCDAVQRCVTIHIRRLDVSPAQE
mmetsp:Transcript_4744/g.12203  ORF Transcript_4744/g.12203 Transcript_4744/m.12203 type:complete len:237 (-) Transcript_4744:256-966(-)